MNEVKGMSNNRIAYIDWAKGVGMLLIMLGHINELSNPIVTWGDSFKIAIFYIISGYLFTLKRGKYQSTREFALEKLKTFGIPYIVFSAAAIVIDTIYGIYKGKAITDVLLKDIYAVFSLRGVSTLWFLPSLFIAEILCFWVIKKKVKQQIGIAMIIFAVGIVLHLGNACINSVEHPNELLLFVSYPLAVFEKSIVASGFFFFSAKLTSRIQELTAAILVFGGVNIVLSQLNCGIDFNNLQYGDIPILFFICGILGSYSIIGLLKWLESKRLKLHYLNFLGTNSLFIMCTHLPLYIAQCVSFIVRKILPADSMGIGYYAYSLCCLILLSIIEWILLNVWNTAKNWLQGNGRKSY
ncbi:MAG: acyltransferase [Lachnoclostridium sp.]|nr:acyltransferase [Lachnospira sp.]MCM1247214.1 acyltransferase [Lachnoclostridium sp.]MCM1534565.1 acyltransferase [Clostridium sp.]